MAKISLSVCSGTDVVDAAELVSVDLASQGRWSAVRLHYVGKKHNRKLLLTSAPGTECARVFPGRPWSCDRESLCQGGVVLSLPARVAPNFDRKVSKQEPSAIRERKLQ